MEGLGGKLQMVSSKHSICFTVPLFFSIVLHGASAEVMLNWVDVGDPGNPENTVLKKDGTSGYGAVGYEFRIGKYETTNFQYSEFLNAVAATDSNDLYHTSMGTALEGGITRSGTSGSYTYSLKPNMGNKPVNFVSWFDAARFANWLHNGQLVGIQDSSTTEDGAYTFSGPETVGTRNAGAQFFLPDEHEWEKAAFYEPGANTFLGNGWWQNPSHSDVFPSPATADATGNVDNPGPNVVVFRNSANWNGTTRGNVTTVGSAGNESFYGARDIAGNVFEWVTHDPTKPDPNGWGPYNVRGSSFFQFGHVDIYERNLVHHDNHAIVSNNVGFRLAAAFAGPDSADFNLDTFVNGVDLGLWEQGYGISTSGDANHDGVSDGDDFLIWQRQFTGVASSAAAVHVPEPTSWLVFSGLITIFLACRGDRFGSTYFTPQNLRAR